MNISQHDLAAQIYAHLAGAHDYNQADERNEGDLRAAAVDAWKAAKYFFEETANNH